MKQLTVVVSVPVTVNVPDDFPPSGKQVAVRVQVALRQKGKLLPIEAGDLCQAATQIAAHAAKDEMRKYWALDRKKQKVWNKSVNGITAQAVPSAITAKAEEPAPELPESMKRVLRELRVEHFRLLNACDTARTWDPVHASETLRLARLGLTAWVAPGHTGAGVRTVLIDGEPWFVDFINSLMCRPRQLHEQDNYGP